MHPAFGHLSRRACLRLTGPDREGFLDKLITQSLGALDPAGLAYGALLSPQGKICADFFIWRTEHEILLDCDSARLEELLERLQRFRLRAAVGIAPCEELVVARFDGPAPANAVCAGIDPRLAAWGVRAILRREEAPAPCDESALRAARVEAGLPDLAQDAALEEVFALEALLEELNGVSFKKGCFPGQENVSRMKRRATTRKKFCRVRFSGAAPETGALILAGGVELGNVRAVGDGAVIALLRLDRAITAREPLMAGGVACRLDPPLWLILPSAGEDDARSLD